MVVLRSDLSRRPATTARTRPGVPTREWLPPAPVVFVGEGLEMGVGVACTPPAPLPIRGATAAGHRVRWHKAGDTRPAPAPVKAERWCQQQPPAKAIAAARGHPRSGTTAWLGQGTTRGAGSGGQAVVGSRSAAFPRQLWVASQKKADRAWTPGSGMRWRGGDWGWAGAGEGASTAENRLSTATARHQCIGVRWSVVLYNYNLLGRYGPQFHVDLTAAFQRPVGRRLFHPLAYAVAVPPATVLLLVARRLPTSDLVDTTT